MKFDFLSSIGVAIVGIVIGFVAINAILPKVQDYSIKSIDPANDGGYNYSSYSEPNNEVFNYDALNPTVEVYIGDCEEYDANGACKQVTTTNTNDDEDDDEDSDNPEDNGENGDEDVNPNGQEND